MLKCYVYFNHKVPPVIYLNILTFQFLLHHLVTCENNKKSASLKLFNKAGPEQFKAV